MSALPLKAGMLSVSIDVGQCQKQTFDLLAFLCLMADCPDIGRKSSEIALRHVERRRKEASRQDAAWAAARRF